MQTVETFEGGELKLCVRSVDGRPNSTRNFITLKAIPKVLKTIS